MWPTERAQFGCALCQRHNGTKPAKNNHISTTHTAVVNRSQSGAGSKKTHYGRTCSTADLARMRRLECETTASNRNRNEFCRKAVAGEFV